MHVDPNSSSVFSHGVSITCACDESYLTLQNEERQWIEKALSDVSKTNSVKSLEITLSHQISSLSSFTPDQISRLLTLFEQKIKLFSDSQEVRNYLSREVADLFVQKDVVHFDNFLKSRVDKSLAIQAMTHAVRQKRTEPFIAVAKLLNYGINTHTPEGQQALIEIAKLAAQQNGGETSEYIQNYGINAQTPEGQKALIEIAKLAAQDNGDNTSKYIQNYGIYTHTPEGQKALIEIAKLAAQQNGRETSEYIQNYGINAHTPEGQKALIEIAKLAAQQNGRDTSEYIQNYGINANTEEGQKAMIEIAMLSAEENGEKTSKYLHKYGINPHTPEGQKALIEIAKLAAQQNGWGTSEYIQNYGINAQTPEGQNALIEIAKLSAQQNGWGTSKFIKNYGINAFSLEGQKALIEIAKLAAQQNGSGTSRYIQLYGINAHTPEGQKAMIEIAKLAVQKSAWKTSEHIQNYGINAHTPEGQKALIEIAKLAAQHDGEGTSEYIQNYGINADTPEGQKALIEIAKLAAQQDGGKTSKHIQNYEINAHTPEGQKALIEIAKLAAQQDGGKTSEHIQNYGINAYTLEGQKALIEIAKLAAQQNGEITSFYIQNYGINAYTLEGQKALIEIAKLAVQQNGGGTSFYIQNYGINTHTPEGQKILIEIAKLAAQQNGWGTSQYIQNYGINADTPEGQKALIEIAKLAAQQNGEGTSFYIQNYGINADTPEGQLTLIEIAKLAAQQDGGKTSEHIQNYGINADTPEGQLALIEIAKLATKQNAKSTVVYLSNYELDIATTEGKKHYNDLANYIFVCHIRQLPSYTLSNLEDNFKDYISKLNGDVKATYKLDFTLFKEASKALQNHNIQEALEESIDRCAMWCEMSPHDLEWLKTAVEKLEKEEQKNKLLEWFICTALLCSSRKDCKSLLKGTPSLIAQLSPLSSELRDYLTAEMIAAIYEAKGSDVDLLKDRILDEFSLIKKITVLPRDLRQAFARAFIEACQPLNAEVWNSMKKATEDVTHGGLACLLLSLYPKSDYTSVLTAIKTDRSLRDAKIQQPMLEMLVGVKDSSLKNEIKAEILQTVFAISGKGRHKAIRCVTDILNFEAEAYLQKIESLQDLEQALEKVFIEKCKVRVDNFTSKYENSIGTWRSKGAVTTYAAKVATNRQAIPYFQTFLTSVLQDLFIATRYALDKNPHLKAIHEKYPQMLEKWKLSIELTEEELRVDSVKNIKTPEQTVVEVLKHAVENKHLGGEQQTSLFPYLSSCQGNWELADKALASIAEALKPLSNIRLSSEQLEERQRLMLQRSLLELIQSTEELEKKLNTLKSLRIKGLDESLSPFYRDLKDAESFLRSAGQPKEQAYQVVDTDDPNHFLLMGTEVLSSCQNVNGSVSLNVGLLGYALDGKHRLALVCDASGKILARTVLRLLVDAQGKPVLFQERMYVADTNPGYADLLRKLALKKAASLGIPLVVSSSDFEKEKTEKYPLSIEAKDKPVPYEYVDALGGLQRGPYTIKDALLIKNT